MSGKARVSLSDAEETQRKMLRANLEAGRLKLADENWNQIQHLRLRTANDEGLPLVRVCITEPSNYLVSCLVVDLASVAAVTSSAPGENPIGKTSLRRRLKATAPRAFLFENDQLPPPETDQELPVEILDSHQVSELQKQSLESLWEQNGDTRG